MRPYRGGIRGETEQLSPASPSLSADNIGTMGELVPNLGSNAHCSLCFFRVFG